MGSSKRKSIRGYLKNTRESRARLARMIRARREQIGVTQEIFAAILGVSVRSVQNWEAGRTTPRERDLDSIWPGGRPE